MMLCERCQHLADFRVAVQRLIDGVSTVDDIEACTTCLSTIRVAPDGTLRFEDE